MHDEIRTYAELQEQMHYALREQHPEWVEAGRRQSYLSFPTRGDSPKLLALFAKSGTRSAPNPKRLAIVSLCLIISAGEAVYTSGFSFTRVPDSRFLLTSPSWQSGPFFWAGMRREFSFPSPTDV